MKSIQFKNKIGGMILAVSVLFGIGMISSSTVQAQWRRDDDQYRRDRDRDRDYQRNRNRDRDNDRDRYRRNDQYGNYGGYGGYGNNRYNSYQIALSRGYQQGIYTGSSDAQRGQSYNPQRSKYWRNPDSGYNSSYGNRGQYQQGFREGFLRGYREGYQQYAGYGNGRSNRNRFPFPW